MTLTTNQILVICLIAVLVIFLIEVGIMAKHAIVLMKGLKKINDDGQSLVDTSKEKVEIAGDKMLSAITAAVSDTKPIVKGVAVATGVLFALNFGGIILRSLFNVQETAEDRKIRASQKRELRSSKKRLATIKKNNKKTGKVEKKIRREKRKLNKRNRRIKKMQ